MSQRRERRLVKFQSLSYHHAVKSRDGPRIQDNVTPSPLGSCTDREEEQLEAGTMATVREGQLMARRIKKKKSRSNQNTEIKLPAGCRCPKHAAITQEEGRSLGEEKTMKPVAT